MTIRTAWGAELDQRPHFVYTLLDGAGRAVYVGLTLNVANRIVQHHKTLRSSCARPAWWLVEVRRVEVSGPYKRRAGLQVERDLIERLQPKGNIQYTSRDPRSWAADHSASRAETRDAS